MSSSTAAVADKAQLLSGDEPASTSPASVELTVSSEVSPATTATATSAPVRNRAGQSASVTKKTPKQIEVEEKMAARLDELEARPGRSGSLTAAAEVAVAPGSVNKGARILSKLLTKVNSKTGEDSPDEEGVINLQREITSALYTKTLEQQNFKTVFTLSKAKHKPKHVEITNYFAEPNFSKPAANRIQLHRSSGGDFTETALRIAGADVEEAQWQHDQAQTQAAGKNADGIAADVDAGSKFGTWDGVFVSCLLNIFGVIMFLRLGWVVGQAGIVHGIAIILLGGVVTILTTASMAAIATNGTVKGGGAYFMISRALGPEIGGTIGVLFFLGLCVAISMYVIGFCETLVQNFGVCPNMYNEATGLLSECDPDRVTFTFFGCTGPDTAAMSACKLNDIRVYGILLMGFLLIMALLGTGWVIKMQIGLFLMLCVTICSFCVGTFLHRGEDDIKNGFLGWGSNIYRSTEDANGTLTWADSGESNLADMMNSKYTPQLVGGSMKEYNFFTVFSIFFPAVTGIMAGANISGLLRDPAKNITVGTFSAIGVSTVVYSIMAFMIGATCSRTALLNDYYIMMKVEVFRESVGGQVIGWTVLIGVYAATFSSALASLVGAPQMLFNVAKDRIMPLGLFATTHRATCWGKKGSCCDRTKRPFLGCFEPISSELDEAGIPVYTDTSGKVLGGEADPVFGYFISFFVACGCILIGDLNFVAPLISMFFMLTYGLLNISCFFLAYYDTPGWRPKFRYFHWSTGLVGFVLCVIAMFLTDLVFAPVSMCIAALLVNYVKRRHVVTNWGTALDARAYVNATEAIFHLRNIRGHVKTFRPSYLVLSTEKVLEDDGKPEWGLLRYMYSLRKGGGCVFWSKVVLDKEDRDISILREKYEDTYKCLVPETKIMKNNAYAPFDVIRAQSFFRGAVSLMQSSGIGNLRPNTVVLPYFEGWKEASTVETGGALVQDYVKTLGAAQKMRFGTIITRGLDNIAWKNPTPKHTVDVWWLIDDGGLSLLVPYIMSLEKFWVQNTDDQRDCRVRLFFIYEDQNAFGAFAEEVSNNKKIIDKFRFDFEIVDPVANNLFMKNSGTESFPEGNPDGNPRADTIKNFDELPTENFADLDGESEIMERTQQWLRVSEIIRENSFKSKVIYLTMPHPRSFVGANLYMSWLEMLSYNMPPMVFIKGNSKDCLTYFLE